MIPVIDLAGPRVVAAIGAACRDIGFLVVVNHGVPAPVVASARVEAASFFARPEAVKRRSLNRDGFYGFFPMASQALAASLDQATPPDLRESFAMGPPAVTDRSAAAARFFAGTPWPADAPGLRPAMQAYYRAMEGLAVRLMRLFAAALDLPETWFDSRIDRHISAMTAIHYPAVQGVPAPGQLRAGAHSDYGSLTILQRDETPGGLQVRLGQDWLDVPDVPGGFVVNLGDLMAEWTGGLWRSTLHRVVNPPAGFLGDRLSIAFFHQPNFDAVIETLPTRSAGVLAGPPITSGEHLARKVAKHVSAADHSETPC